jgi:hypothetical protein
MQGTARTVAVDSKNRECIEGAAMKKQFSFSQWGLLVWAATIILSITVTARVTRSNPSATATQTPAGIAQVAPSDQNVALATNAAYRDGLFQGRLARERGTKPHIAVGRWSSDDDRAAFSVAYERAYSEPVTSNQ